jgi:hypothetical protein
MDQDPSQATHCGCNLPAEPALRFRAQSPPPPDTTQRPRGPLLSGPWSSFHTPGFTCSSKVGTTSHLTQEPARPPVRTTACLGHPVCPPVCTTPTPTSQGARSTQADAVGPASHQSLPQPRGPHSCTCPAPTHQALRPVSITTVSPGDAGISTRLVAVTLGGSTEWGLLSTCRPRMPTLGRPCSRPRSGSKWLAKKKTGTMGPGDSPMSFPSSLPSRGEFGYSSTLRNRYAAFHPGGRSHIKIPSMGRGPYKHRSHIRMTAAPLQGPLRGHLRLLCEQGLASLWWAAGETGPQSSHQPRMFLST